jgi:hypothetical protein
MPPSCGGERFLVHQELPAGQGRRYRRVTSDRVDLPGPEVPTRASPSYLFTDESGGPYSRPQLFLIPGEGWLSSGPGCFPPGLGGFPPGPGWLSSWAWTAFLRGPDGLPPGPGRPSSGARTAFLRSPDGLPPEPGRLSFRSRAVFLQLQDRLPPWPGRSTRERILTFTLGDL